MAFQETGPEGRSKVENRITTLMNSLSSYALPLFYARIHKDVTAPEVIFTCLIYDNIRT